MKILVVLTHMTQTPQRELWTSLCSIAMTLACHAILLVLCVCVASLRLACRSMMHCFVAEFPVDQRIVPL